MHRYGLLCALLAVAALEASPRNDAWEVLGPGGGGSMYAPTVSPHDAREVLIHCDMTGSYISHDGGNSFRMFNLRGTTRFFVFDPSDPDTIYVQTVGLWRSTNRGKTWRLVHPDPASVSGIRMPDDHAGEMLVTTAEPRGRMTALAVDPADSKALYAAIGAGLYLSPDWGKTWKNVADLRDGCRKIYIDPRSPEADRTVYVIGGKSVAVREGGRWTNGEAPNGVAQFTAVSGGFPEKGGRLAVYVTSAAGAFSSDDGGRSWRGVSLKLPFSPRVPAVAASERHGEIAYVAYDSGRNAAERSFGIARTADTGRTWEIVWDQARVAPPHNREAWMVERFNASAWGNIPAILGVAPTDPNLVFGVDLMRAIRSTDGGKTWDSIYSNRLPDHHFATTGLDVTTCYGLHFDPFDPRRMVISYTDIGQYRSEDGGKSWIMSTNGIPRQWRNTTYWMVFDPEVRGRVWGVMSGVHDLPRPKMWRGRSPSAYNGGLCRSEDGAASWTCDESALPPTAPTHILLDPTSPAGARVLYVAAFGRGVFKSVDDGRHWTLKNNGLPGKEPLAWRLARDSKGVLYLVVARRSEDGSYGNDSDGGLYRSTDGAEHWTRIPLPEGVNGPNGIAIDPRDPTRLYLAAWGRQTEDGAVDGGIFASDDAGRTWRHAFARDQHVYDVTIDPRNPRVLYGCGFEDSAWRSEDRGRTWRRIRGYNFKWGHRVIPDPVDHSKIYITTFGGSLWHGPAKGDPRAAEDIAEPGLAFMK